MKSKDLTGERFGRLQVIRKEGNDKYNRCLWLCKCDCGNTKIISSNTLLRKKGTKSCGCIAKDLIKKRNTKHGLKNKFPRLYQIWSNMKYRCNNPNSSEYKNYGGRGIKVCEEWEKDFETFYKWAIGNGYSSNLTIERKDVNGSYEPSNCTWITKREQALNKTNNKLITLDGETKPMQSWCDQFNIDRNTVKTRLKLGWNYKDAFTVKPVIGRNQYTE